MLIASRKSPCPRHGDASPGGADLQQAEQIALASVQGAVVGMQEWFFRLGIAPVVEAVLLVSAAVHLIIHRRKAMVFLEVAT